LSRIRIVDLTMVWAGPYGTRMLADMGADVIKVEGVTNPDLVRGIGSGLAVNGERPWDRSPYFNEYNRGKRGITLELTRPEGRQALLELVRTADVLIENYRADVLDRLNLAPEVLHAERPDLVIVSMPGFAKHGMERDMVGYGPTIEQMGGLVELTGYEDGPAQRTGISYGDPVAGIMASAATIAGLLRRQDGRGAVIEVSQRDNLIGLIGEAVVDWSMNGRIWPRRGNRHAWMAPHGCYQCRPLPAEQGRPLGGLALTSGVATDRWITIAVATDAQWQALCEVMRRPDLAADPRFTSAPGRHQHQDEIDAAIAAWAAEQDDDGAMAVLQSRGVPAFPVRTPLTMTTDPHLAARDFFREVVHPVAGPYRLAGPLWNFTEPRVEIRSAAPSFGQHNDEVLGGLLGLPPERIDQLRGQDVVSDVPRQPGGVAASV
jgi:crotonobetainyl-CoA:carnitine CoA-transferase CaiB-like acyl-CoA transferase